MPMQGVPWPASKFYIYSGILIITHALQWPPHRANVCLLSSEAHVLRLTTPEQPV